ncbi:hypothetical protein ACONUD_02700 [Microbulbifer harenosus]|uniref:Uncharacterized protein n=1 Tax=Microbulbifer harenosus TaxID=2576840 RepID=A0ABY2UD92_9GAMM|nr:hypothetical protein [Microbulbifer harenosus]TLM73953.1 hypothetical protein FDY93_18655 [Microbulbifer harenosus]
MKIIIGIILACFLSRYGHACSFAPGYQKFLMAPSIYRKDAKPEAPKITVKEIRRGEKGDPGMCADAGILVLKIENFKLNTGYSFTIENGVAEDSIFPEDYIAPVPGSRELMFVWLDGASYFQEPIELKVKVVAISLGGTESQPGYVKIEDPGRPKYR